jgi:hypothetical protein
MAEREGFEPSIRDYRIHTFQACSFNHSDTSPDFFLFPALTEYTGRDDRARGPPAFGSPETAVTRKRKRARVNQIPRPFK